MELLCKMLDIKIGFAKIEQGYYDCALIFIPESETVVRDHLLQDFETEKLAMERSIINGWIVYQFNCSEEKKQTLTEFSTHLFFYNLPRFSDN